MIAPHHPPPHPHHRPATSIVRHQTNRSPQFRTSVIVLRDTRIVMPAFVGGRPVQSWLLRSLESGAGAALDVIGRSAGEASEAPGILMPFSPAGVAQSVRAAES